MPEMTAGVDVVGGVVRGLTPAGSPAAKWMWFRPMGFRPPASRMGERKG